MQYTIEPQGEVRYSVIAIKDDVYDIQYSRTSTDIDSSPITILGGKRGFCLSELQSIIDFIKASDAYAANQPS